MLMPIKSFFAVIKYEILMEKLCLFVYNSIELKKLFETMNNLLKNIFRKEELVKLKKGLFKGGKNVVSAFMKSKIINLPKL
jgi:hypothetical protein